VNEDLQAKLSAISAAGKLRDKQYSAILRSDDEIIALVLRAHLIMEELLFAAVAVYCPTPKYLQDAQLRFPQLAALVRALAKQPFDSWIWDALSELNALRNALSHNLEPQNISDRVARFVNTIKRQVNKGVKGGGDLLGEPVDSKDAFRAATHYLLGAMSFATDSQVRILIADKLTIKPSSDKG
jgi:hypothetical protein